MPNAEGHYIDHIVFNNCLSKDDSQRILNFCNNIRIELLPLKKVFIKVDDSTSMRALEYLCNNESRFPIVLLPMKGSRKVLDVISSDIKLQKLLYERVDDFMCRHDECKNYINEKNGLCEEDIVDQYPNDVTVNHLSGVSESDVDFSR